MISINKWKLSKTRLDHENFCLKYGTRNKER